MPRTAVVSGQAHSLYYLLMVVVHPDEEAHGKARVEVTQRLPTRLPQRVAPPKPIDTERSPVASFGEYLTGSGEGQVEGLLFLGGDFLGAPMVVEPTTGFVTLQTGQATAQD